MKTPAKKMSNREDLVAIGDVERKIYLIRGHRVMVDSDLAALYGVPTHRLNEQVRRNRKRFPSDFMFALTSEESVRLRSQIAISNTGRGGRRYPVSVFTEQGVAMLSGVLKSDRAIDVNAIMRTFVKLRNMLASNVELGRKLDEMEKKYDVQFRVVFDAIRALMRSPEKSQRRIGFKADS